MKANNVLFEYQNQMLITSSVQTATNWINSLPGLKCNEHTADNLNRLINQPWKILGYYHQYSAPVNKDGYTFSCLKTTGIGKGEIKFSITKCNTPEEVVAEREAYRIKIANLKIKVADISNTIGNELLKKLSKKSKSCVVLQHRFDTNFLLEIGQEGYWIADRLCPHFYYPVKYSTYFNGETLLTEGGKSIIDIINNFYVE